MLRMQPHEPIGSIERTDSGSVWVSAFPSELPWDPAERFRDEIEEATEFFQSQDALELKFERDHMWGIDDPTKTIMFLEKAFSIES